MDGRVVLGDIVVAIDGEWMQGMGFDVLKERIVGNIGTFVDLTFESVRYIPPSPFLQQIQLALHASHPSPLPSFTPPISSHALSQRQRAPHLLCIA